MGLIRYSCGHISGPHVPIPTKPPWTDSCEIWCVRVFHVLLKYGLENAEMQKTTIWWHHTSVLYKPKGDKVGAVSSVSSSSFGCWWVCRRVPFAVMSHIASDALFRSSTGCWNQFLFCLVKTEIMLEPRGRGVGGLVQRSIWRCAAVMGLKTSLLV